MAQSNEQVVREFVQAYKDKDALRTFDLLHQDFVQLWKNDTVIYSKNDFRNNFAWGEVMQDFERIEIIKSDDRFVETLSTYYCDRDKLLGIKPFKSKRIFEIRQGQIVKIRGEEFDGYAQYDQPRRVKFEKFFAWLAESHELKPIDFPFDKNGAEKLKEKIREYTKN